MLTVEEIKKSSGLYSIPKYIHVNKGVCFDFRLFDALSNPSDKDYTYDFDVFLPKYGINLQRDYVWEHCQQNEFILSLLQEKPIDPVILVQYCDDFANREMHTINYVIDGKQRLLTIKKFANNEFPIIINGCEYYFSDFSDELKRFLDSRVCYMTGTVYYSYPDVPVTDDMLITLFNFYNFAGTPQTEEHKNKLESLLKK